MKKRFKIIVSTISCMVAICLMLFGVYASVSPTISLSGNVSYSVRDAAVCVQGKVINSGYDVDFDAAPATKSDLLALTSSAQKTQGLEYFDWTEGEVSTSDLLESAIPQSEKLSSWNISEVQFEEDNNGIKDIFVIFQVTNYSNYPVKVSLEFNKTADQLLASNVIRVFSKNNFVLAQNGSATGTSQKVKIRYTINDDSLTTSNVDIGMSLKVSKEQIPDVDLNMFDISYGTDTTYTYTGLTSYYKFEINENAAGVVVFPATYDDGEHGVAPVVPDRGNLIEQALASDDWMMEFFGSFNDNITKIIVSEGITDIAPGAFAGCVEVTEIVLPTTLKCIGGAAMTFCTSLSYVNIPESVEYMPALEMPGSKIGVFSFCMGLQWLYLPKNVEYINSFANYCSGLQFLAVDRENTMFDDFDANVIVLTGENEYFDNVGDNWISLLNGSNYTRFDKLTHANIKEFYQWSFMGMDKITSIEVPEGVEVIGGYALGDCEALEEIIIPQSFNRTNHGSSINLASPTEAFLGNGTPLLKKVYTKSTVFDYFLDYYEVGDILYIAENVAEENLSSSVTSHFTKGDMIEYKGTNYYKWTMTTAWS